MAITEDTTNPAIKTWTGAWTSAQTTASFTAAANTLIVAILSAAGGSPSLTVTGAISDSLSGGWTLLKRQNTAGTNIGGTCEVWIRNGGGVNTAAPGAMTVSAVVASGTGGTGGQLNVLCLLGADITANQNGATAGATFNNAAAVQVSVAAGTGGKIYGAALNWSTSTALTVLGNTSDSRSTSDATNGDWWGSFKSTGDTAGTATYGYSTSVIGHIAAAEIKTGVLLVGGGSVPFIGPLGFMSPVQVGRRAIQLWGLPAAVDVAFTGVTASVVFAASVGAASVDITGPTAALVLAAPAGVIAVTLPGLTGSLVLGAPTGSVNIGAVAALPEIVLRPRVAC